MDQNLKNPLNVIFGSLIQNERKRMPNETIESLCEKGHLGISPSLYKMIEAGHASFNINKIKEIIKTFYQSGFRFNRLIKYISAQNLVDSFMYNLNESQKTALSNLAEMDEEFKALYSRIEKYFDLEDGSKAQKEFMQDIAVMEVKNFLQNDIYPIDSEIKIELDLVNQVKKVPSLNIELLVGFLDSFAKINPQHFGHIAADWEEKNSPKFKSVVGIYSSPKFIVDENNLGTYTYNYLTGKGFNNIRYIFISDKNPKILEQEFEEILNRCRRQNKLAEIPSNVLKKKVIFKTTKNHQQSFNDLLRDPNDSESILQAFWMFTTKKGYKVAFIGVSKKDKNVNDVNIVYNLSYEESQKRGQLFDKIWNQL